MKGSFLRALSGPFKKIFTPAVWALMLLIHPPVLADPWTPPIGIPMPSFGIVESHTMYQGQLYDYDNNGTAEGAYKDAGNGPYTHYVDRSAPNCTDGSNNSNYGTPALPRCTIPGRDGAPLKAGSVVEVHGKHDYDYTSPTDLHFAGTAVKPVFIRGASASNRPTVTGPFDVVGSSYTIVENILFSDRDGDLSGGPCGSFGVTDKNGQRYDSDHIAFRHNEVSGNIDCGGTGIAGYSGTTIISNIVLWDNTIHDNGDVNATFDQDVHGIAVGGNASYVWVVDNEMYRNSGDGLQINGSAAATHHIYVGRNVSHHNKQTGLWTKSASDVIFSENRVYRHRPSNSSNGGGMGFQYDPNRVWFLFNESYDNVDGIVHGSGNAGGRAGAYYIGNLLHDNLNSGMQLNDWVEGEYVIGNTFYNNPIGLENGYYRVGVEISNNIFSKSTTAHISFTEYGSGAVSNLRNSLFDSPVRIVWDDVARDVAGMQGIGECLGCKSGSPLFVNAVGADFNLQSGSPAIDAGAVEAAYAAYQSLYGLDIRTDKAGRSRPQGAAWDIGAYESGDTPADTTPPTVSITAPAGGATVSGTAVTVSASASDNVGVVGVQFKLDGANLGSEDTSSPYALTWNTTQASDGSHTLTAVARDAAGNTTTSSPVSVTVSDSASSGTSGGGGGGGGCFIATAGYGASIP